MKLFNEISREIPIAGQYDVIVCGGGPAGVAAAITSARGGAKTCLMEMHGCLGGVWTSVGVAYILDAWNKKHKGLLKEILEELKDKEGCDETVFDVETMKYVLEDICVKAGIEIRLYTRLTAAYRNDDNRLETIVTESKSGREAWKAKVFIDATGDGDLAAYAGCGFDFGDDTGRTQPMSLLALVSGVDPEECRDFINNGPNKLARENLYAEMERGGKAPSYSKPALWHVKGDLYSLMANHEYGISALSEGQMSKATLHARKELNEVIEALRSLGGIWKGIRIAATGSQIGVREGRRIHGIYTITKEDLMNGTRHEDAVCEVTFKVDIHSLDANKGKGYGNGGVVALPYDIPLRALIAKDVEGLLMAGRCISGDFFAHASYRVTGNAVAMGEAAGELAVQAVLMNKVPRELINKE